MSSTSRILIVEDEILVAMALQGMLEELGYEVESVSNLEAALKAAEVCNFAAAILDFYLHGRPVDPVADVLARRGIPYAISSGMDKEDMCSRVTAGPMLPKPYLLDDVSRVLSQLLHFQVHPAGVPPEANRPSA